MDGLEPLLAAAGFIWLIVVCRRGSPALLSLATVIACGIFGVEFWHAELGGTPITTDRLLIAAAFFAFIVQWRLGRAEPKPLNWVDVVHLAFVGWLIISLCTHEFTDPKEQSKSTYRLLVGYLIPTTLYFLTRQSPLSERVVSGIRGTLTFVGIYLAFTAACEITKTWSLVFPAHIADPEMGLHFGRARGPMCHSVSFGVALGTCLLNLWVWRSQVSLRKRRWLVLLVPLFLCGILFSLTRSVWMGTAFSLTVLLALTLTGRLRRAFVAVCLATVVMLVVAKPESLLTFERERSAENTKQSAALRASFAYLSWQMFQDAPVTGFGFGQFYVAKMPYIHDRDTELLLEPIRYWVHHNTFLSILVELGAVGFALFLALLAGWIYNGWQLYRCPHAPDWVRYQGALMIAMLALYAPQLLFHELSFGVVDNSYVYFMAGVTAGLRAKWCGHKTATLAELSGFALPAAGRL